MTTSSRSHNMAPPAAPLPLHKMAALPTDAWKGTRHPLRKPLTLFFFFFFLLRFSITFVSLHSIPGGLQMLAEPSTNPSCDPRSLFAPGVCMGGGGNSLPHPPAAGSGCRERLRNLSRTPQIVPRPSISNHGAAEPINPRPVPSALPSSPALKAKAGARPPSPAPRHRRAVFDFSLQCVFL